MGCKFPKWHCLTHFFDFTVEYGTPTLTYTGSFEKSHRFLCKLPYLRTQREGEGVWEQIVLRVVLAERVTRTKSVLEVIVRQRQETLRKGEECVGVDTFTQLKTTLDKFYPKRFRDDTPEEPSTAAWDNTGYTKHKLL